MKVALVFNMKRESIIEDNDEPPSSSSPLKMKTAEVKVIDKYAEWDTAETINAVAHALSIHNDVTLVEADENVYGRLRDGEFDIVFNIAEGMNGVSREAQMPAMFEFIGLPYTGSDPLTLATCLDKARTKEILSYHGVPTSKFVVAHSYEEAARTSLRYPLFVKPLHEGSSKGIFNSSYVATPESLRLEVARILDNYEQPALVEEYLPGREFTVALLGNGSELKVLPPVEMNFSSLPSEALPIYSYEAKWLWDTKDSPIEVFRCPAPIDDSLRGRMEDICKRSFEVLRCRDWCRIDVRLDASGEPNVMEVNPLPGILPDPEEHSCFPMASRAAGLNYDEMINSVLSVALKRIGKA
ncbi:MAG: ATP-grasp domain-containing protein [Bacteroidetes bacterium]|nr:ATP-grasp domain-containing protein [Bacteroidota bacterium]